MSLTDPYDTGRLIWRIIEDTLPHIVIQVRAVVVRFYGVTLGIVGVSMKSV
jgi:hypothetical protein